MRFGDRVRMLRVQRGMTQQALAQKMSVSISYISKVENEKLHFGDYPSEKFIHNLANELSADEDELLLLADKIPGDLRQRIRERPQVFRLVASLDERSMDALAKQLAKRSQTKTPAKSR